MRVLVVDVANVMGSRPDGWWRDRLGAANRLLAQLGALTSSPDPRGLSFDRIVAVVEGQARRAVGPDGVDVVVAPGEGDDTIVAMAGQVVAAGDVAVVVTADRGLRARLPTTSSALGPRTLLDLLALPRKSRAR